MFYPRVDTSFPINVSNLSDTKGRPLPTYNADSRYRPFSKMFIAVDKNEGCLATLTVPYKELLIVTKALGLTGGGRM